MYFIKNIEEIVLGFVQLQKILSSFLFFHFDVFLSVLLQQICYIYALTLHRYQTLFGTLLSRDHLNHLHTKHLVLTASSKQNHKLPVRANVIFLWILTRNNIHDDTLVANFVFNIQLIFFLDQLDLSRHILFLHMQLVVEVMYTFSL